MTDATTDAAPQPDTQINVTNRALAGQTKQYLDDLLTLRTKTTEELGRGVREGYLTAAKARELADTLGVERPRIRSNHYVYFEVTIPYRIQVSAYDDDDALRQAQEYLNRNVRNDETSFGTQTQFADVRPGRGGPRRRYSVLSAARPDLGVPLDIHPGVIERAEDIRSRRVQQERVAENVVPHVDGDENVVPQVDDERTRIF